MELEQNIKEELERQNKLQRLNMQQTKSMIADYVGNFGSGNPRPNTYHQKPKQQIASNKLIRLAKKIHSTGNDNRARQLIKILGKAYETNNEADFKLNQFYNHNEEVIRGLAKATNNYLGRLMKKKYGQEKTPTSFENYKITKKTPILVSEQKNIKTIYEVSQKHKPRTDLLKNESAEYNVSNQKNKLRDYKTHKFTPKADHSYNLPKQTRNAETYFVEIGKKM